jgi:Zn-dependent metalloprotease
MNARRVLLGTVAAAGLAMAMPWSLQGRQTQAPAPEPPTQIPSLSEPGESLTITQRSPRTGFVRFAASRGNGILVSVQESALPETRARSFIGLYGQAFGLADNAQVALQRAERDALGLEHVRFRQTHLGVPVTAGDFIVHLRGSRVMAANGRILDQLPPSVAPAIGPAEAAAAAAVTIGRAYPDRAAGATYETPRLEVFNRGMLEDGTGLSRLAWFVEARGPALREYIWIDAQVGGLLLNFSQLTDVRNRMTYDGDDTFTLPGSLARSEGEASIGDADVDAAHDYAGDTYDYFWNNFGRDSYDGAGATMISTAHHCPMGGPCPYANAFWSAGQTVYGEGFALADDVVAHEFTHAVTEHSADLFYYYQSGALNESYSDIFGESIDMLNGKGTDTTEVRWLVGEDIPGIGAIRNMIDPPLEGHPGKMSDPEFFCIENGWTNPGGDAGGVHLNSGVPNHAYAHMVDGGEYNGHTMTGIDLSKAAAIQYRALTTYLTSGATFLDNANALEQACADLVGGAAGITAGDCTQVQSAIAAVEMRQTWDCTGATQPPPLCPTGAAPASTMFFDDFESGIDNTNWFFERIEPLKEGWYVTGDGFYVADGAWAAWGRNPATESTHALRQLASTGPLPANSRLYFDHSFEFENAGFTPYDGGFLEYSVDGGSTWDDAGPLIDGGQAYTGTITEDPDHLNPRANEPAFVFTSYGFTGTRLDLSSLAGQSVRFRFLIATDDIQSSLGWFVDNVRIYSCGTGGGEMVRNGTFDQGATNGVPNQWGKWALPTLDDIVVNNDGNRLNFQRPAGSTQAVVLQETGIPVAADAALALTFQAGNSDTVRKRISVLLHDANFQDLSVCTFWLDPSAPLQSYTMRTHTTQAWANATVSLYAASTGTGFYQVDAVSLALQPAQSSERTDCLDANAPAAGGTGSATNLLTNGDFSAGLAPWGTHGNLAWQLTSGVFEFFKLTGLPSGVVLQGSGDAMEADQKMLLTLRLGNSSSLRQRVTILLHHESFADLHACTFYLPPGLPLSGYAMRTYATIPWGNATVAVYPATVGTSPSHEWLQLDDASLTRVTTSILGTECFEPGDAPS